MSVMWPLQSHALDLKRCKVSFVTKLQAQTTPKRNCINNSQQILVVHNVMNHMSTLWKLSNQYSPPILIKKVVYSIYSFLFLGTKPENN